MIQRPQTILLGLVALFMLACMFLPNWEKTSRDGTASARQNAVELSFQLKESKADKKNRVHLTILMGLVAGLSSYSISRYNNRLLQMKLGFGITLGIAATLVFLMLGSREGEALVDPDVKGRYLSGFYLLFIALFSNIISNRLIRRDENLVRSMDRIR
jgi:hypothetical protein